MANLLSRLFARFQQNAPRGSRRKNPRVRTLRVEAMEARRLLVGDLGAIAGNVFTDLTDNGLDGGDTAIVGTNIHLYRDGGNSNFESTGGTASGDDVFVATIASDGSGNYRFDDLIAGTYFVEQAAVTGQVQRTTETVKTVTLTETEVAGTQTANVDTYNDGTAHTVTANTGTPTVNDTRATAEANGGERDVTVNHLAGGGSVEVQVNGGFMNVSTDAGTTGNATISYDGTDGDAATLDHTNLSLDLTTGGATAFHALAGSQGTVGLVINIFSGAGNSSQFSVAAPTTAGASATDNLTIEFTDFATATGTGADFTNVTAITFTINMSSAASDAQFDFSRIVSPTVDTQNFANLNPMSTGNLVFNDVNNNGIFDTGTDTGIAGVQVELYTDTNTNGTFDNGTDVQVGSAVTTDASGLYVFDNLLPGEYIAVIRDSQFAAAAALENFVTSTGNDPAPDPDAASTNGVDKGTAIAGVGVATAAVTLASGSEPTDDGDTNTNSDLTLDFGFTPTVDISVTKTASATTFNAGEQVTYTIVVTNSGSNTTTNVVATDNLPDDFTIVSATSTGGGTVVTTGPSTGEITVTYASLTAGQSETLTIVAGVPEALAAAAAINNVVAVTSDGLESNTANNTANVDVAVTRNAVLTITKTDTPDPAVVGGALVYTILVSNTGPSSATNVVVADTLPAGLTFGTVTTTAGTVSEAGGVITGNLASLADGASFTITVNTTVTSTFTGSTIANTATANADEATLVTANSSTAVNPQVDLVITKTDNVDPANRGGQVVYTMQVTNNGPSGATNVEVVDTLPAGVTFVSATGGTVTAPTGGSSDVTIAVGALASGAATSVTVTVNVDQTAAATVTNSSIVRSTESTGGFDTNTANNTATEATAIQSTIDLAVTKTDSADPIVAGQTMVYTIIVTNSGVSDATGVNLTDNLPDGIRITSATSTVGTVSIPASAQDTTAANNDDLTVTIGNLAASGTATITVNAEVLPDTRGSLSNVATVATSTTGLVETVTANNTATETTAISSSVDLAITKTDSTDPVVAGNALTYTILVTNNGPSTANAVTVSDVLPTGVTFTSVTTTQGSASNASGTITGNLGAIAPSGTATITVIVNVDEATRGTLSNTATVTSTETDSNTANNSATQSTTVNASVDLAITKTDSIDPVTPGSTIVYTIVVTNNGPSEATGVSVADTLPTGLTFVSATTTVGSVSNTGNALTGTIGTLASGGTATITVNATVDSTASGTLSNTATVTGTESESNSTNNSATQTTDIAIAGSLSGRVYVDANQNGVFDSGEAGIAGVSIALSGTDAGSNAVNRTEVTDANGLYTFATLLPGTYALTETQPTGVLDGTANVGTGATGSTAATNAINTITLGNAPAAAEFNFGEILSPLSKRRFLASSSATS